VDVLFGQLPIENQAPGTSLLTISALSQRVSPKGNSRRGLNFRGGYTVYTADYNR